MTPNIFMLFSFTVFIIGSVVMSLIGVKAPLLSLNENQILYLYSTSAQVLAGIYGLTLTGFIFFRNELSREEFDDDTLTDAVERLKSRYFKLLIFITGQTLISLLLSNLVISIESDDNRLLVTLLMNVTQVSYVVNLGVIAYFIFDVIAPKRIERASRDLQKEVEPDLDKEAKGSLENFLKNFNQIEYILQKYGQAFQQDFNNKYSKHRRRMSNVRLAEVILQAEKIDPKLFDELRQLITLRNSIVHGASPTVSESMVNKSHEILVSLSDSLNVIVPEN
ncbi:TPA: hypothetical protein NGT43_001379 [Vibrio parahaemolyticus]|uniref:HEPN domain-containing protein n=1 Tax=Vibrio parahaemolyticus TaxID=670 RepID=UPI000AA24295|nr:HEPN domain-containing protein [Vibrio parahaemolyticus]EKB1953141.1 hypothetical protein [Vibrio parahaemolyticus]MBE3893171.1 hypothetical protein [Vibrio parahaemolyticus]MBE3941546.1 hypothetical protein [Vibrio parahaemolyticus]MBM4873834.1 hypothetical protein [Vibrio parahaemolyticus]MDK9426307.1 HEPN domain-containing protein [Vibrio parahaemolyticus]